MRDFSDQVIVITGGTGNIGKETGKSFLLGGGKVFTASRKPHDTDAFAEEMGRSGIRSGFEVQTVDLRNIPALQSWIGDIVRREGKIDVLVNAAGTCPLADVFDVTEEVWDDVMSVNLKAAFFASQQALKSMVNQRSGKIINIGSIAAYNGGVITTPPYGASKGGLHSLTKWFASKFSPYGIQVNAVVPGPVQTKMIAEFPGPLLSRMIENTPDRRLGETADVVQAVMFLADRATTHITGAMIDVCGGLYLR